MSIYGLTHEEMIDTVSNEVGNVSIAPQITNWLNIAQLDIASKYVFRSLHTYANVVAIKSIVDTTLPANFYWLKTIGIPAQQRKLYPIDEQRLSEGFPQYRTLEGTISYYYINGDKLGLWQVPSVFSTTLEISYQRYPSKLIEIDSVSELPVEWHSLVLQKAITKAYSQEGNSEGFSISMQMEARLLRELQISAYRRPDETFILNGPQTRGRLPRPKLPSNYPNTGG